jgi:hypothetical protein
MNIELIASTNGLTDSRDMIEFGLRCARVCYTEKDWEDIQKEPINEQLLERLVSSGHHSVFEHMNLTFDFNGMSKALVMLFNNEKQYATSEKSARYTVMSEIEPEQKALYDKWMGILIPEIDKVYPETKDASAREGAVKKLAQENARYMTSVFTPTKMVHTINLRQLNFLQQQFEKFRAQYADGSDEFKSRLATEMQDFLDQTENLRIERLDNQTDRGLSYFSTDGLSLSTEGTDMYSRVYPLSFAGLAQAHRHRTISYNILSGTEKGAKEGFFVPKIVKEAGKESEWYDDLSRVAEQDFPQAQLLKIYERGRIEDFRSKAMLRLCGHAQLEIMKNTLETAEGYESYKETYGKNALNPKCLQGMKCPSNCVWTGKRALERLV